MKKTLQLLAALVLVLSGTLAKADPEESSPGHRKCKEHATNICYQVKNSKGEVTETVLGMPYTTNM